MNKILTVFDGSHFSRGALNFACKLNESEPVLLTGIFLPSIDYSDAMIYYLGGMVGPLYFPEVDSEEQLINENIKKFEEVCRKNNLEYRVHRHTKGGVIENLVKESRYSDLLLLGTELFYENLGKGTQDEYLKDTLHRTECPIILVPENYTFPQSVIIAYDGSDSSVFALKQFAYIFPQLSNLSTVVVYASDKADEIPDLPYVEELAARHYKDMSFYRLETDPKVYFNTWISNKGNAMLVTGSYSRSSMSELFKKNFAREVIQEHKLPVFIAHH